MKTLTVNNLEIPISFRRSRRAKRLRMQIDSSGRLELIAPWLTPKSIVNRFVVTHTKWIEKQVAKIEIQKKRRPEFNYRSGDTFYYFGEPVVLMVKPSVRKRPSINIRGYQMIITLHREVGRADGVAAIKKAIENFYKKKAEEVIHDRLQHFNEFYGYKYNRVTLRNQKSRWGSCSARGNLNFNWRLIMAPIEVIDYVVVHELCHLKEMNHSARFWKLVEKAIPKYKEVRRWLRENHFLLNV